MVPTVPNKPVERTAHLAGFFGFCGIVAGGPPLTAGVRPKFHRRGKEGCLG
jgi:hypothetical protein